MIVLGGICNASANAVDKLNETHRPSSSQCLVSPMTVPNRLFCVGIDDRGM